jgi:hypothetical protein
MERQMQVLTKEIPSASTGIEELDKLISGHVKESIQVNTPEAKLLKRSLLWPSCCSHLCIHICLYPHETTMLKQRNRGIHTPNKTRS